MTAEEAIEALKHINLKRVHPFYDWEEMKEIRDIAIEALEKQIPYKPIKSDREIRYCEVWKCPKCGFEWSGRVVDYCYKCGQHIDWSEEE